MSLFWRCVPFLEIRGFRIEGKVYIYRVWFRTELLVNKFAGQALQKNEKFSQDYIYKLLKLLLAGTTKKKFLLEMVTLESISENEDQPLPKNFTFSPA